MSDAAVTKKIIAASFKELCRRRSFDKISITDITDACGLKRQTFYYHFRDKFELLDWIYFTDAIQPAIAGITFENSNDRLLVLLNIMQADKPFYWNTIRHQEENFQSCLHRITCTLFCDAIDKLDAAHRLTQEDKTFYAQFYSFGLCGTVLDWVKGGMRLPPERVAAHLKSLIRASEKLAVRRYAHLRRE